MKYGNNLIYKYAISDMVLIKELVNIQGCCKCQILSLDGMEV